MAKKINVHRGSCLCGGVEVAIHGDFEQFVCCHCERCQKGTGSAHGANLFASGARIEWLSGAGLVTTFQVPETRHVRSFCSTCGSAMPHASGEQFVMVPAGCLDTPTDILPTMHIFCSERATWEDALARAPRFEALPSQGS